MANDQKPKGLTLADFTLYPPFGTVVPRDASKALERDEVGCYCDHDVATCRAMGHDHAFNAATAAAKELTAAQGELSEAASGALEAEQYVKRDAEFAAWYDGLDLLQKESRTAALKIAFNAGWAARKKAEYEMVLGLDKPKAE